MRDFWTRTSHHHYEFIQYGQKKPNLNGSVSHLHKEAEDIFDFVHWLKTVIEERYTKHGYVLRYIIEHVKMVRSYEAVFYKPDINKTNI